MAVMDMFLMDKMIFAVGLLWKRFQKVSCLLARPAMDRIPGHSFTLIVNQEWLFLP